MFQEVVPGVYPLGSGIDSALPDANSITGDILNTRDLANQGNTEFAILGPGSAVYYMAYSISIEALLLVPPDPTSLTLFAFGSFDTAAPFTFVTAFEIPLPVYNIGVTPVGYTGRVRMDHPAARFSLVNTTGTNLTVSFFFWAKPF